MKIGSLLVFLLFSFNTCAGISERQIFIKKTDEHEHEFVLELLTSILVDPTSSNMELIEFPEKLNKTRLLKELRKGFIEIAWTAQNEKFARDAIEIPIPIFNNLFGHRLLLVRESEQHIFESVKSLEDLKSLTGGLGADWSDTLILDKAGLKIRTGSTNSQLVDLLLNGEVDYFPRALHEAWYEYYKYQNLDLVVERKLVLIYELPIYFYVSKANLQLAEKLKTALTELEGNGLLDKKFADNYAFQKALSLSDIKSRTHIYIPHAKKQKVVLSGTVERTAK